MNEKTSKAVVTLLALSRTRFSDEEQIIIAQTASKLISNELTGLMGDSWDIDDLNTYRPDLQDELRDIVVLRALDIITTKHAKEILNSIWEKPYTTTIDYIIQSKLLEEAEGSELDAIIDKVIADNTSVVDEVRGGKVKARGFLVGQIMKLAKGKANPTMVQEMLISKGV